ncbi:MAG TPA: CAP domain-containing protein [Pyrinomonadaceae bacterium]
MLTTDRRSFCKTLVPAIGSAFFLPRIDQLDPPQTISTAQLADLRMQLLTMINEERDLEGVSRVDIDDLATQVATAHAQDMAQKNFASHWGSDGRKPYHRYSFAGGIHATEENVSSTNNTWSLKPADLRQDVAYLHVRLYGENPPNDGHRRAILAPQHTHVGFGIAVEELRLRVVELFVAKHLEVAPVPRTTNRGATFELSGKVITPELNLAQIQLFYEPLPTPPALSWLQTTRSYGLPDDFVTLRIKLRNPLKYIDGTNGVFDTDGRNFHVPIHFFRTTAGIYTIACWVRKERTEKPFIAAEICIRTD